MGDAERTKVIASWVDGGRLDPGETGPKAASLAAMAGAGLPVPPGFVVVADALAGVGDGPVPPDVEREVVAAYRAMGEPPVAVRSSATAEDLAGASFAGQYDTVLGVQGRRQLLDAVRTVCRSLRSERAVAYRRARGIGEEGLGMAVIVQELVDADAAGVLFTRHPLTGAEDVVMLSAAAGLGEGVVAGTALVDTYVLETATGALVEQDLARETPVLGDADRAALLELAARVRAVFGDHRDIEFAIRGGAVFALQARPITALDDAGDFPVRWADPADAERSWMLRGAAPIHALEIDIQRASAERMRVGFGETGSPMMRSHLWQVHNGYLYVAAPDVDEDDVRARQRRLADAQERYAAEGTSIYEAEVEPVLLERLATIARIRSRRRSLAGRVEMLEHAIAAYTDAMGNLHWRIQLQPNIDWPAQYHELTGRPPEEAGTLLQAVSTRTSRMITSLRKLARIAQSDDALRDILDRRDWPALDSSTLDSLPAVSAFRRGFATLLRAYGLRTGMGMGGVATFTSPTWNMSPGIPLGVIGSYVRQDLDELDRRDRRLRAGRQRLERAIAADLASDPERLARFELARKRMVNAARTTEDHNHLMEQASGGSMREAVLLTGEALVDRGLLTDPDDVFHLSLDELRAIAAGRGPADVPALVRDRIALRARQQAVRAPRALGAPAGPDPRAGMFTPPEGAGLDGNVLRGLAASRGRHTGPARVAPPDHAPPDVRPGDVLVASLVGEAWTPIFPLLGGLVLDFGGIFQHAAVVAREYGIPAVMMTRDATKVIVDGQTVTVDGDAGLVELA